MSFTIFPKQTQQTAVSNARIWKLQNDANFLHCRRF